MSGEHILPAKLIKQTWLSSFLTAYTFEFTLLFLFSNWNSLCFFVILILDEFYNVFRVYFIYILCHRNFIKCKILLKVNLLPLKIIPSILRWKLMLLFWGLKKLGSFNEIICGLWFHLRGHLFSRLNRIEFLWGFVVDDFILYVMWRAWLLGSFMIFV